MVNYGYIKLHREITEHWVYKIKPFSKGLAWIDLLLQANYGMTERYFNGKVQRTEAGQLQTSMSFLAERWGWSKQRTINFIKLLEKEKMLSCNRSTSGTTITIENWGKWQDSEHTNITADVTAPITTPITAPITHNKKDKNYKEYPPKSPQGEEGEGWKIAFENLMKEWELEGR